MKNPTMDTPARPNGLAVLLGLNNTGKHIYAGSAPVAKVQRNRAKAKAARKARRRSR